MSSNLDGTFPATAIHKNVRRATSEGDGGPRGRFPPRPSLAKASLRRRFSVELSTETLCQAAIDEESFYGAYGDMRKKLDCTFCSFLCRSGLVGKEFCFTHAEALHRSSWMVSQILTMFTTGKSANGCTIPSLKTYWRTRTTLQQMDPGTRVGARTRPAPRGSF